MQSNRLFEIIYLLMGQGTMTAQALARRLEVSVRTIYRDIDTLSAAGIPVYTTRGKGGGVSLLEGAVLNRTVLTGEEQDQILLALQTMRATGQGGNVLGRLSALFGKAEPGGSRWIFRAGAPANTTNRNSRCCSRRCCTGACFPLHISTPRASAAIARSAR